MCVSVVRRSLLRGAPGSAAGGRCWASLSRVPARSGGSSRTPLRLPAKSKVDDLAASLSVRMGDLLLTDKEGTGLVIKGLGPSQVPKPTWAVVGKVCSPRRLVIDALERAMQKAWSLHSQA